MRLFRKSTSTATGRNRISLWLLAYLAWRNLVSKKLRTGLTLAGVIIGIGAIFFLISFGLGLQKIVTDEIVGNQSIKSIDVTSPNSALLQLDSSSLNRFSELANVESVGGSLLLPGVVAYASGEVDSVSYAVDDAYQRISALRAVHGRLLQPSDNRAVLVNTSLTEAVGLESPEQIVDKEIELTIPFKTADGASEIKEKFIVVGVIDSGAGSEVFLPSHILLSAGAENFTQIKIVVTENDAVATVRGQVEALGYETLSPIDTIDQINQIFSYFNIFLGGFGAIGMIVAVLGMFNTLTISLLERTKEIGLMIALGARSRDMKKLFVLEALLLSIAGALIGVIMAMISGSAITMLMNSYARSRGVSEAFDLFATPLWLIVGTVIFMSCIGLIVVFFPARRAERISPIEALRRE